MDKNYLLETAKQLQVVTEKTAKEYKEKSSDMVLKMNQLMISREDISTLVGEKNLKMMKDNHANHARFIASILQNYNHTVLVDTVLWVFRAYQSHGFKSNYWSAQLNCWIGVLRDNLTPNSYQEVLPYYEWMQINIPLFTKLSEEELNLPNPSH